MTSNGSTSDERGVGSYGRRRWPERLRLQIVRVPFLAVVAQATQLLDSADAKAHAKDPTGIADYTKAKKLGPTIRADASNVGVTAC